MFQVVGMVTMAFIILLYYGIFFPAQRTATLEHAGMVINRTSRGLASSCVLALTITCCGFSNLLELFRQGQSFINVKV